MKRFILTGTPGAGKTLILRQLELDGFGIVEEAATDLIALWQTRGIEKPWLEPSFLDAVAELQRDRQLQASGLPGSIQFHDRSAICTAALAEWLKAPITNSLARELDRIARERIFANPVFFIRNLGFVAPTSARQIQLEEALEFERLHEKTYRDHGFDLFFVEPGSVRERADAIQRALTPEIDDSL